MNKYNIEAGIDFYAELYKSLDVDDSEDDNNTCLITNQVLTDKYVTLECGHKFNYIPLYNDLKNHKNKFNLMEGSNSRLHKNEIRCPYCRSKQTKLLPYYEELGLEKINGVNYLDQNVKESKYCYYSHHCQYKTFNPSFDESNPESDTNKKYISCTGFHATKISIENKKKPSEPITYGDNKYYCYCHKKIMIKEYKLKEKEKEKELNLQLKAQAKAEKEKAKQEAKLMKQKEKEQSKLNNKNLLSENVILESSIVISEDKTEDTNNEGCIQILKSGPKKGHACCSKIYSENICKRHYLLNNKEKN